MFNSILREKIVFQECASSHRNKISISRNKSSEIALEILAE